MSVEILRPGMLSTLQDLGRHGYQHYGVVVDGAMDEVSHRVANLLVGNDEAEATLELTLLGPELRFARDTLIALAGADMAPHADGRPVPMYRPLWIAAAMLYGLIAYGDSALGWRHHRRAYRERLADLKADAKSLH